MREREASDKSEKGEKVPENIKKDSPLYSVEKSNGKGVFDAGVLSELVSPKVSGKLKSLKNE